jgi:3-oxoacyl-[acyl-carrier-protein] synthase-3
MTQPFKYAKVKLKAYGYQLPPNVVTSQDLEERLAPLYQSLRIQKGQLEALTGIRERRFWEADYSMATGALKAASKALSKADMTGGELEMLVYGGVCRDHLEPATACAVADGIGLNHEAQLFDLSNACLGVLNGMVMVANAIELGQIRAGMVVSCESARGIVHQTIQRMLNAEDMTVFKHCLATLTGGSGAVAVILTDNSLAPDGCRLIGGVAMNDTRHHRLCMWGPDTGVAGTATTVMNTDSVSVLKNGVALGHRTYRRFQKAFLGSGGMPDKIICHQVGASHQKTILETLRIPPERDFSTYRFLGNIGTVSLPITMAMADERGFFTPGDLVGLFGIGSGLNCLLLGIQWA